MLFLNNGHQIGANVELCSSKGETKAQGKVKSEQDRPPWIRAAMYIQGSDETGQAALFVGNELFNCVQ